MSCIYCLQSFYLMNLSTLWTPNSSTTQTPPLCTHFKKNYTFNNITTTSSNLIHHPSFNLQETTHLTLLTRNISSRTHSSQTCSKLSNNSVMEQTLTHALLRESYFILLVSPIYRFRSLNTFSYLLNLPQSVHSDRAGTSFRLT